ncbi:MAG: dihydrofolate reductase [Gammaproteobacteria bacterium]|nr:dihydrofolate reductase [Gammaproteobacteria bacterium]
MLSLIWAMDQQGLIGVENRLPWHLPADMAWFRQHTLGKTVLMGRKTFDSFGGKPLPQRQHLVVSSNPNFHIDHPAVEVFPALELALSRATSEPELMVIGGASIYQQLLNRADRLYVTIVKGRFNGDAWFPAIDWSLWQLLEERQQLPDVKNSYGCHFAIYTQNHWK